MTTTMDSMETEERALLERRVEEIFLRELQVEVPGRDIDVIDSGLVDSLSFVRLLSVLEREFQLQIDLDRLELDDFRTVSSIAGFLEGRRPDAPEPMPVAGD